MITTDARTGASAPVDGRITFSFEIALLAQHVEHLGVPGKFGGNGLLINRVLASLPVSVERAQPPIEVSQLFPGVKVSTIRSYLSDLAGRGLCQRVGSIGHSRYYRES